MTIMVQVETHNVRKQELMLYKDHMQKKRVR